MQISFCPDRIRQSSHVRFYDFYDSESKLVRTACPEVPRFIADFIRTEPRHIPTSRGRLRFRRDWIFQDDADIFLEIVLGSRAILSQKVNPDSRKRSDFSFAGLGLELP